MKPLVGRATPGRARGRLGLLGCLAAAILVPGAVAETSGPVDAVAAIEAQLEVERQLLAEDLERYEEHVRRRAATAERLQALYDALDRAVREGEQRVETLIQEVERAEAERTESMYAERLLVDRLRERRRRILLLEERLAALGTARKEEQGPLHGAWDVVLLPLEQRGTFNLRQLGTLVSGTYELQGGWTGSLQGTLIGNKLYLVRIDSKRGRSMELEGRLSSDGTRLRGNWQDLELAAGLPPSGEWSAQKRSDDP